MIHFKERQAIASMQMVAEAEQAWNILIDTEHWLEWGPAIRRVETQDRFIKSNSVGRVQTAFGLWLPFTITDFQQNNYWCWRIGSIEATGHRVIPTGAGTCTVAFSMPWWALPYTGICHIALRRIRKILES